MNPARLLCAQVAIAALLVLPARGDPAAPGSGAPAMASENYTYANVNIGGGGFVTGIIFNPAEKGLCYVRTDVGGAYRWNPASARWEPLLDWVSQADWNLQGVESLASDPLHPARVYIAAGTYARSARFSGRPTTGERGFGPPSRRRSAATRPAGTTGSGSPLIPTMTASFFSAPGMPAFGEAPTLGRPGPALKASRSRRSRPRLRRRVPVPLRAI